MKNFFRTFIATLLLVITGCMVKAQTTDTLHFSVNDIEMEATGEYTRFLPDRNYHLSNTRWRQYMDGIGRIDLLWQRIICWHKQL